MPAQHAVVYLLEDVQIGDGHVAVVEQRLVQKQALRRRQVEPCFLDGSRQLSHALAGLLPAARRRCLRRA
eukprot:7391536-Prymnesium_polylepis.2